MACDEKQVSKTYVFMACDEKQVMKTQVFAPRDEEQLLKTEFIFTSQSVFFQTQAYHARDLKAHHFVVCFCLKTQT